MAVERTTVLVVGYAKLPDDTAAQSVYGSVGVALELEAETGVVLRASCTMVPALVSEFVAGVVAGARLPEQLEHVVGQLQERYLGPAQSAIVAALRAANDRWESHQSEGG